MSVINYPTTIATPPAPPSAPRGFQPGQMLILRDVSYASYVQMCDAIVDYPRVRFTYDRGTLEIMSTSGEHEWYKDRLGRLLDAVFAETNRNAISGGSQTFRSEEIERGFEPDQCYWIANWEKVREPFFLWHPDQQPPPDLVIEIEVTRSAINKLDLFSAYRVPEVWRFDGTALKVYSLDSGGAYQQRSSSPTFSTMPIDDVPRMIGPEAEMEILAFRKAVRAWIRQWAKP